MEASIYEYCDAPHGAPQFLPLARPSWFRSTKLPTRSPTLEDPWLDNLIGQTLNLQWNPHGQHIDHEQLEPHEYIEWNTNLAFDWTPKPEEKEDWEVTKSEPERVPPPWRKVALPPWRKKPMKVALTPPWRQQRIPDADESKPERDEIKPDAEQSIPDAYENAYVSIYADQSITESNPVADDGAPNEPATTHDEDTMHVDEIRLLNTDYKNGSHFDVETQGPTRIIYGNQRRGSGKKTPVWALRAAGWDEEPERAVAQFEGPGRTRGMAARVPPVVPASQHDQRET